MARKNDRIIDLKYYMAGDETKDFARYEHITRVFLNNAGDHLSFLGLTNLNELFLAGTGIPGIEDGWCPASEPCIQGIDVNFIEFDWKRITGLEENTISWPPNKEAFHALNGEGTSLWEDFVVEVFENAPQDENYQENCRIILELLGDLYEAVYPDDENYIYSV